MTSSFRRPQLSVCATVFLLAGCSGSWQQTQLAPVLVQQNGIPFGSNAHSLGRPSIGVDKSGFADSIHLAHPRSWMAPNATNSKLLYISDASTYNVTVYSYPAGQLVGTLTGFLEPAGECVDKKGNVFITSSTFYGTGTVFEYAHGGTEPIATLNDPYGFPYGCSVDLRSGNLAVTNQTSASGGGNVLIYAKAQGTPTEYSDSAFYEYFFCGYDGSGNLFVDGRNASSAFKFAELTKGSSVFTDIALNQAIKYPAGVQWDGEHVSVGDYEANVIYQFAIAASAGTLVGSTPLTGAYGTHQFWIEDRKVIVPDSSPYDPSPNVGVWDYPDGGNAKKTISSGLVYPVGAVVSKGGK